MEPLDSLFTEWESDFYHFLSSSNGGVNHHSRTNYMSWLKFLSNRYELSSNISEEDIDAIIESERMLQSERNIYNNPKDLTNFRSALRKFRQFFLSKYKRENEIDIEKEINKVKNDKEISDTEREAIVKARVGQGIFRQHLIDFWGGCSISRLGMYDCLVASHIKPWRCSTNEERLSVFNGLLLQPNYDCLFDKGYISFDKRGKIIFSKYLPLPERKMLGLNDNMRLYKIEESHKYFLKYHNDYCLMQ